ncbi:hypothetical protein TSUD_350230 [Trifolium subterraneum]|uniref:Uncharacterized protein n=1 Tax=Trifolium subterraneum TaxID=3900 RepID=A0A2Z6PEP7_TRISU|nr:hypothetical protein TSUD_350230 [Trifolium subterraneum]
MLPVEVMRCGPAPPSASPSTAIGVVNPLECVNCRCTAAVVSLTFYVCGFTDRIGSNFETTNPSLLQRFQIRFVPLMARLKTCFHGGICILAC